jgi:dockerin type I repeat protein
VFGRLISTRPLVIAAAAALMMVVARDSRAQDVCRGDVDDNGVVMAADVDTLIATLFGDAASSLRADANGDGVVDATDLTKTIQLIGSVCAGPTRTSTKTPTIGPSSTPTPTQTPRATATPTQVCTVQTAHFGSTSGALTASDCTRSFQGIARHTDVYSIAGTPGTAIKVEVTGTGPGTPISPEVVVIDADGEFARFEGVPPVTFTVVTSQPYELWVGSTPQSAVELGNYTLTLTALPCPTPIALVLPSFGLPTVQEGTLDGTECPDPVMPGARSLADVYTFTVPSVPTNISIIMRQVLATDSIDPVFSVLGPDGVEVVTGDEDDDLAPGGFGADAQTRFLALTAGTYTILASGNSGTGQYRLFLDTPPCAPKALPTIPPDHPLQCVNPTPGVGCTGTLYGNTSPFVPPATTCGAPLPIPGISDDTPEPSSAADLYSFTAQPGDVISVQMESDDDAHLYLIGPASAGNPLVAQDDDSGALSATMDAQLAATLAVGGTYTLIAANNNFLQPPEPPDDPEGDVVNYTLFIQKCPVGGRLTAGGLPITGEFSTLDCLGFGDIPFKSYVLNGQAGQFVTVQMTSTDTDAFVRLLGPDGSIVDNDNDLFDPGTSDARINRILPVAGTYFVETSVSPTVGVVDLTAVPGFTVQAASCPTNPVVPGTIAGSFDNTDCELAPGRKFDVYTFDAAAGPVPRIASLAPPSSGCLVSLLAEGPQTPAGGCTTGPTDMPVLGNGVYGFMLAAKDETTRGAYTAVLRSCEASTLGYGGTQAGALTNSSCLAASGLSASWSILRAPADLVQFNGGFSGAVQSSFPLGGALTDLVGEIPLGPFFADDATALFASHGDLVLVLRITGTSAANRGTYTLSVDPATFRQ